MMFDTYMTIVGNVLNNPEWRRTTNTGAVVVNFKVASTSRRFNRETGEWVDGNSLRVRVTCWRRLAEGVGGSVKSGDPVVVVGRLYTREWEDDGGNKRLAYELEAVAVGHDLSKGRAQFARVKAAAGTSMVEDADAEARAGGELTSTMSSDEIPVPPPSDLDDLDAPAWADQGFDPLAALRASGLDPVRLDGDGYGGPLDRTGGPGVGPNGEPIGDSLAALGTPAEGTSTEDTSTAESDDPDITDEPGDGGATLRRRGRARVAVPV